MTLKVESVVDHGMHAEEALGRSSRFEQLHLSLSSSHRLMGIATAPRLKRSASTGPLAHQRLTEDLPCSPSVLYPLMPISGGARGCGDGARFAAKSLAKQVGDIKSHDVIVNESHAVVNRLPRPWITTGQLWKLIGNGDLQIALQAWSETPAAGWRWAAGQRRYNRFPQDHIVWAPCTTTAPGSATERSVIWK